MESGSLQIAELLVVISRKVSADKQKGQVPDGTPNCKKKKTNYLFTMCPFIRLTLRASHLGTRFLEKV